MILGYTYDGVSIGVDFNFMGRENPCLVICEGNMETKYATFNNENAARQFIEKFSAFVGNKEPVDWNKLQAQKGENE